MTSTRMGRVTLITLALLLVLGLMPLACAKTDDIAPYNGSIGSDSPLYGLKLFFEGVDEVFTFDVEARLEKQMLHAGERLAEAKAMLLVNNSDAAEAAISEYKLKVMLINDSVSGVNITKEAKDLVSANLSTQKKELQALSKNKNLTDAAKKALQFTLGNASVTIDTVSKMGVITPPEEEGIMPDSPLYGLKLLSEDIDEKFTFDGEARLEKRVLHAEERIVEAKAMLLANNSDAAEAAISEYKLKVMVINASIPTVNVSESVKNALSNNLTKQKKDLETLSKHENLTSSAKEEIQFTLDDVSTTMDTVSNIGKTPKAEAKSKDIEPSEGGIGPDNPLYGLKLAFEAVDESFTFDRGAKLIKQVLHARERIAEAKAMLLANNSDAAEVAVNEYNIKIIIINGTVSEGGVSGDTLKDLLDNVTLQKGELQSLSKNKNLTDTAKKVFQFALSNTTAAINTISELNKCNKDGVCDDWESYDTCPEDCPPVCDNDVCESPDETPQNCPTDCHCGNGNCEPNKGEDYFKCRADCPPVCGNDVCESPDETPQNCAKDCPCGDGVCDASRGEDYYSCRADCGPVCGNGKCERPDEHYGICANDCGGTLNGNIVGDVKFDKSSYNAGDTIKASVNMKNTGTRDILSESVNIKVKVTRLDNWVANTALGSKSEEEKTQTYDFAYTKIIAPGSTGTLSATFDTPEKISSSVGDISLAGDYNVVLTVSIEGTEIGSKTVKVTLH